MLLTAILLILFGLTAFDQSGAGRILRRLLVQAPARMLSRLSRGQVLGLAIVVILGWAAVALFEAEGLRLFSMAAPEMTAWFLMFDVTVVFDMMVLAIGLRAVAGWRGLGRQMAATLRLGARLIGPVAGVARSRARRVRRPRPPRPGSNDWEPDAVFA